MKYIHITLDLPLMPCLRLLIVWNIKMSVRVSMSVFVSWVEEEEVWMSLLNSSSQSCMSRHVNILISLSKTPLISLTHTHMRTHKMGDTPPAHAHSITLTLHTLSHTNYREQQVWEAVGAADISNLFWFSRLRRWRFHLFHLIQVKKLLITGGLWNTKY